MFVFLNFNIFINLHFAHTLRFPFQLSYFCTDPQATVTQGQYPSLSKSHLQYFVRTGCCSSINFSLLIYSINTVQMSPRKTWFKVASTAGLQNPHFFFSISSKRNLLGLSWFWDREPSATVLLSASIGCCARNSYKHSQAGGSTLFNLTNSRNHLRLFQQPSSWVKYLEITIRKCLHVILLKTSTQFTQMGTSFVSYLSLPPSLCVHLCACNSVRLWRLRLMPGPLCSFLLSCSRASQLKMNFTGRATPSAISPARHTDTQG